MLPKLLLSLTRWSHVSILTRPGGRVLQSRRAASPTYSPGVSILTRPGGRVLRFPHGHIAVLDVFQSSPDPEAGCYWA